jgi:membrane protease subunit (stomatin/prohibitin family)
MGILRFAKKQFIDILEWTETGDEVLAWRFPTEDFEIQQGGQLVVRETQMALFVDQGRVADLFGPGTHEIHTRNLPVLTDLRHWDKGFESPFKSEVYFFSTRLRLNQTWGTSNPLTIRDREFGAVRVRAYGVYSYRIADPRAFFDNVSGTRESYLVADLESQLRSTIVSTLTDHLGSSQVPFIDIAASQTELAGAVLDEARAPFAALGLALEGLQIQNVSLPEELQKRFDERIGMGMIGDLSRYTQFELAQSIPSAASSGGAAGAGVGIGAGFGMGQAMSQAIADAARTARPEAPAAAPAVAPPPVTPAVSAPREPIVCGRCESPLDRPSRFCPECGAPLE